MNVLRTTKERKNWLYSCMKLFNVHTYFGNTWWWSYIVHWFQAFWLTAFFRIRFSVDFVAVLKQRLNTPLPHTIVRWMQIWQYRVCVFMRYESHGIYYIFELFTGKNANNVDDWWFGVHCAWWNLVCEPVIFGSRQFKKNFPVGIRFENFICDFCSAFSF